MQFVSSGTTLGVSRHGLKGVETKNGLILQLSLKEAAGPSADGSAAPFCSMVV
jgi:hypothetical protein